MAVTRISIGFDDLILRMRQRIADSREFTRWIVWQQNESRLLIDLETLKARALKGWLLSNLDVQTDETGRVTLQVIFYLGTESEAGPHGVVTINAPTAEAAQIADRWGHDIQRILWDAILDGVEVALESVSIQASGRRLGLAGIFSDQKSLLVDIILGDR